MCCSTAVDCWIEVHAPQIELLVDGRSARPEVGTDLTGERASAKALGKLTRPLQGILRQSPPDTPTAAAARSFVEACRQARVHLAQAAQARYELDGLALGNFAAAREARARAWARLKAVAAAGCPRMPPASRDRFSTK